MKLNPLSLALAFCLPFLFTGCQSPTTSNADPHSPALLSATGTNGELDDKKGSAQLWSQTCNRCHNTRSPDSYSAKEWAVVMTHMRVRGYLTGEEQRAILEFLQR